jgi:hypothetical protein
MEFYTKEAFMSTTFEVYCAPPEATLQESLLGAKYIVVFFKADEAPSWELDGFVSYLETSRCATPPGELQGCYDSLLQELQRMRRDTTAFQAAVREMCVAMQEERKLDRETMTEEQYRSIRKHIVAVPSYSACWEAVLGQRLSVEAQQALDATGVLYLVAEIVYLCNDLGSLERDEETVRNDPQKVDLNFVLLQMRTLRDRDPAIRAGINLYNQRVEEFQAIRSNLARSKYWSEQPLPGYLERLRSIANGNLTATKHLIAQRYGGSQERLDQLRAINPWDL